LPYLVFNTRRPDGWNSGQMGVRTGWHDCPDGWQGIEIFDLSRSRKSSESALNSGIPVYSIFTHTSDFVQNEAKILTLNSSGIQYRILAVLSAQGTLFIGWGFKWATALIKLGAQNSWIFAENLSCLRAASGRWGTVIRTVVRPLQVISLLRLRASRPWDGRPDGWSSSRNFHICWAHVRTMATGIQTVEFELRFLPYVWARPDGNPHRPDGCSNLPLFELGKKIWESSE
jgi:hypothetical protein